MHNFQEYEERWQLAWQEACLFEARESSRTGTWWDAPQTTARAEALRRDILKRSRKTRKTVK